MADTVLYGTNANDTIQANASGGVSNGSLILTVAGTIAQNEWPTFDVLINGVVARTSVMVSADDYQQGIQHVYVQLPGTVINSVTIDYTNDPQTDYTTQDRNLVIKDVNLNGTHLAVNTALYTRDGFTGADFTEQGHVIQGQEYMLWGGEMTFSGSAVSGATAGAGGSRLIDGENGIDTVVFASARSAYTLGNNANGFAVTPTAGGTTTLLGEVERVQFGDGSKIAIDMDGNAGVAAKMIAAMIGNQFLASSSIVGTVLGYLDAGISATQLAGMAAETNEFKALAGGGSNANFVRFVYHNLAGVDPSTTDLNYYTGLLDGGYISKGAMAVAAMNLDITDIRVEQVGVHDYVAYS